MLKKGLWLLLGAAFIWITVDFVRDTKQNKQMTVAPSSTNSIELEEKNFMEEPNKKDDSSEVDTIGEDFDKATKMTVGSNLGQTAYDFELTDMDGKTVKLSDYRGKKVFLNFWGFCCKVLNKE